MGRLRRFADGLLEAGWLAAVVLVPLFLDKNSSEVFERAKAGLLQSIAVWMLVACLIKALAGADATADAASALTRLARAPLALATAGWLGVTLLATALSLSPSESFWGHRGRAHGALTLLALVVIACANAANMTTLAQRRRFVSALLAPSIPIALYAIFQRFGLEPLHIGGRETEAQRVTSLLGQPVYLAAYLGMLMPFSVLRAREAYLASGAVRVRGVAAYGLLLALQLAAFAFSESRGPLLGLGIAAAIAALTVCARRGAKKPVIAIWLVVALGVLAVSLRAPEQLKQLDTGASATRAAETFAVTGGGGQFRKTNWIVAERVLRNGKPVELADGTKDPHPGLRHVLGYGPEVQQAFSAPFYDAELPKLFDYFLIERFHNQLWDVLLTTGVLGLCSWLALQSTFLFVALRALGMLDTTTRVRSFWASCVASALTGALVAGLIQGVAFTPLGLQVGVIFGVAAFVSGCAFAPTVSPAKGDVGLFIAALAAMIGHLVETSFAFAVLSTSLVFWLLLAVVARRGEDDARQGTQQEEAVADACVLAWLLTALGFVFVGGPGLSARAAALLWDSLTLVAHPEKRSVPVFAVLALATLSWFVVDRVRPWRALRSPLAVACAVALLHWLRLASVLAELATPAALPTQIFDHNFEPRSAATTSFYVCCALVALAFAVNRARGPVAAGERAGLRIAGALLLALLGVGVVTRVALRPAHADAAAGLAEAFKSQNRIDLCEQAFTRAQTLLPHQTFYTSQLAKAYVRQARVDAAHADTWLDKADAALRKAIAGDPTVGENATNLALVTAQRTQRASGARRDTLRLETVALYQRALRLNPFDPALWRLWAGAQVMLLNDPLDALESVNHAATLERPNALNFAMLGEVQLALARVRGGEMRTQSLLRAAAAFEQAKQLAPQPAYDVSTGKAYLAAGQPQKAAASFRAALAATPSRARDRSSTLALLKRAESELALATPPAP